MLQFSAGMVLCRSFGHASKSGSTLSCQCQARIILAYFQDVAPSSYVNVLRLISRAVRSCERRALELTALTLILLASSCCDAGANALGVLDDTTYRVRASPRFRPSFALQSWFHANLMHLAIYWWKAPLWLRQRFHTHLVAPRVLPSGRHLCGSGKGCTQIWLEGCEP